MEALWQKPIAALYREMFPVLMAYAQTVLSPAMAEEAVQETFEIACQKTLQGILQTLQSLFCSLQSFVTEVYGTAIVCLEDEETDGHWAISLCQQRM